MKISIVMANYNRRKLLINTLKTIEFYNKARDIEIIVVDDNSDKSESVKDLPGMFQVPVIIIPITKQEKNWTCCCMPFNIGFSMATGDIIIIQNPENLHVGDIVGYALRHIKKGIFLSYALLSMNQVDTDLLYNSTIKKGLYAAEHIKKIIKPVGKIVNWKDGDTCWYNHSVYQPAANHLISAITRWDLEDLHGFDERYGAGFAYDDFEFKIRLERKGMITKIVDEPFAIHQRH
ncbi:MAG: glycosyltransferase, partial [Thermoanaerobaculaceae bacterium]|nr:glycosyltransferase [Thermoanaerobaculaceae bacterium]